MVMDNLQYIFIHIYCNIIDFDKIDGCSNASIFKKLVLFTFIKMINYFL